ncbi:NUDIX domain-containing protein [Streptomyces sp. RCU064]|uniref:NUDIX domain-containing protein n=1 Tax=Streptomyces rugosispiralis TaxID=2967341 RepID=A0ABT1USQ3_9ACTN|nr:NUDIX domain-containing protein [Streptomyces rugosispiralis]
MGYTRGRRVTHCSYCGTAFAEGAGWPRDCSGCGETQWRNPLPAAVVLQPVATLSGGLGVVVVRRAIEPALGRLALPGGYVEVGETWQEGAVRELREETGLAADPGRVRLFDVHSTRDTLEVLALLPVRDAETLPEAAPMPETAGWQVLDAPVTLAFDGHTTAVAALLGTASPGAAGLG